MPPQDSLAPVCETTTGHLSGPTPEPRTPSPGDPPPQHLEGQRAEMSLSSGSVLSLKGGQPGDLSPKPSTEGAQQNTKRLYGMKKSTMS